MVAHSSEQQVIILNETPNNGWDAGRFIASDVLSGIRERFGGVEVRELTPSSVMLFVSCTGDDLQAITAEIKEQLDGHVFPASFFNTSPSPSTSSNPYTAIGAGEIAG